MHKKGFVRLGLAAGGLGILLGVVTCAANPLRGTGEVRASSGLDLPTNPTVEALTAEMERVTQQEMESGCVEWSDRLQQDILCGESRAKVEALQKQLTEEIRKLQWPGAEAVAAAVANIRAVAEDPSLQVMFDGTSRNPYMNDHSRVEIYLDSRGMLYLVNPANHEILQFGPAGNSTIEWRQSPRLDHAALRQVAESFLSEHVTAFSKVKEQFIYEESSKGEVSYSFRWRSPLMSTKGDWASVSVVVSPGGEIMSFVNTLSLFEDVSPQQ